MGVEMQGRHNDFFQWTHPSDSNPERFEGDTVRLYRGQSGDDDTLGIHWTRNPKTVIANHSNSVPQVVHSAVVSRKDIIPRAEWFDRDIKHGYVKGDEVDWAPSQWGFDWEEEVRLRPGAVLQGHAVAENTEDGRVWKSTGRSPVIDVTSPFKNLAHAAVQGTPQAEALHRAQAKLPHVQPPLPFTQVEFFDPVSNESLGYVEDDAFEPDSEWEAALKQHSDTLSAKYGKHTIPKSVNPWETVPMQGTQPEKQSTDKLSPQFANHINQLQIPGLED